MEIDGIQINVWTHGQLVRLASTLEKIISLVEKEGWSLKELVNIVEDSKKVVYLAFQFLPLLSPIVSETIGVNEEELDEWPFDKVARVALMIFIQNAIVLKHLVSLGNESLKSLN